LKETTGPRELWADLCAFAICGRAIVVGTCHFPSAIEVFNRQVHGLKLGPVKMVEYKKVMFPGRDQAVSPRL
jgi:hypothetical protein